MERDARADGHAGGGGERAGTGERGVAGAGDGVLAVEKTTAA